jgi:hypothetical protein
VKHIATLSLLTILCLALGTTAFAGTTIFGEGPVLGGDNALFIDGNGGPFSQSISDGFVAAAGGGGGEVYFGEWVLAGDTPTGVTWAIGNNNFSGTLTAAAGFGTTLYCSSGGSGCDGYGYDVYISHFSISGTSFTAGDTYWLTLTNATDSQGTDFNGWDLTAPGPATCDVEHGAIVPGGGAACGFQGESFTITNGGVTTPEPSSILLLGSGILGLAGVLRRKLTR